MSNIEIAADGFELVSWAPIQPDRDLIPNLGPLSCAAKVLSRQ